MDEAWLQAALREATARLRAGLPADERQRLDARDEADRQAMLCSAGPSAAQLATLPARTTGDAAWLVARGEDGRDGAAATASAAGAAAAAAEPPGTRYRWAKDEALAAAAPTRLCGGAVRASGENASGEAARQALDGQLHSKWLDFGGAKAAAWLEYRLPAEAPPVQLASYALTSANDCPERDPRHVVLEAWSEGEVGWKRGRRGGGLMDRCREVRNRWGLAGYRRPAALTRAPMLPHAPACLQRTADGWRWTNSARCASPPATTACTCRWQAPQQQLWRRRAASAFGW